MKGNKSVYILLPVVAIVWGLIAYRVVKYVDSDSSGASIAPVVDMKFEGEKFEGDTFSILANYSDPFEYAKVQTNPLLTHQAKPSDSHPKQTKTSTHKFPTLIYKGSIKNKKNGKVIALITVNNTTKNVMKGETFDGLKIIKINNDSIKIRYGAKELWIYKNKI